MISILVPTYGRTALLGEMVECFLRQDLDGPSELVILNDLSVQQLVYRHELPANRSIRLVNVSHRFRDLGVKRNELVRLASYDVVTFWDDDDIYLPHRLSGGLKLLQGRQAFSEASEWRMGIHHPTSLTLRGVRPMGALTVHRDALKAVGGFPDAPCIQDCALVVNLVRAGYLNNVPAWEREPSTIYRLHANVSRAHVTNNPGGCDQEAIRQYVIGRVAAALESGEEPSGEVAIEPQWSLDYQELAHRAWLTRPIAAL
jgi:glycosyltransferase involved in cell wall biosynthesis